jgi:Flp pilus assembly protein TadG
MKNEPIVDRGSISGFVVVLTMTFIACAGLAFDGGRMITARIEIADAAENAARAGAQEVTSLRSGNPTVHEIRAVSVAEQFLRSVSVEGTAIASKQLVTVTARREVTMAILGMFGVRNKNLSVSRSARPFVSP